MPSELRRWSVVLTASLALCACSSPARFERESDAIVEEILGGRAERLNANRRAEILMPEPARDATEPSSAGPAAAEPRELRRLTLRNALECAVHGNRQYTGEREGLYQQALSLYSTRHGFGPLLTAMLNSVFSGGEQLDSSSTSLGVGVSQRLPWGGSLSASASAAATQEHAVQLVGTTAGASIALRQPLLRGFGHEAAMESLVQAERGLLYSIREFELFRENFSIDVARRFYGLVQQRRGLENQRRNLEDVIFFRRQAEAMFALGDTTELEVLRARRSELTSQNDLISAEEDLRRALDSFRIFLGLPDTVSVDVEDEAPRFAELPYDADSAVEVALHNRLDVLTRRQRLEDSERSLRIAANSAMPDIGLSASYGVDGSADPDVDGRRVDVPDWSIGFDVGLPIDRTSERESLRRAQIAHGQALRSHEEFLQNLAVDIRSAFRELERRTQSLDIQRQLIFDQERNVKIAQLRFEQGDFSNRDVVEAQQALLEARNALIREQVDYEIARLGLIRDLGLLFIDEHGMWDE